MRSGHNPFVSCVMPTADRAPYVPQAIRCFLAQTYGNRELVILDDGKKSVEGLIPSDLRIRYFRLTEKHVLGAKRNMVCDIAQGEVIAHWDDDDWSAAGRLGDQIKRLLESKKGVTGYHRFFYWDDVGRRAYQYQFTGAGFYAAGSTQCYLKSYWQAHPFASKQRAEDSDFSFTAAKLGQLTSVVSTLLVARAHAGQGWKVPLGSHGFPAVDLKDLPAEFLEFVGVTRRGAPTIL